MNERHLFPRNRRTTANLLRVAPRTQRAERTYAHQLNEVARNIQGIVGTASGRTPSAFDRIISWLERYADDIEPWAQRTAVAMLDQIQAEDFKQWIRSAGAMGAALRREIEAAPTGVLTQQLLAQQVGLIKSLPREAAQRIDEILTRSITAEAVHRMAIERVSSGARAEGIFDEIMRSGEVAASRARTIARTETSRAHETFTRARAEHIRSPGYIWRTAGDGDVRKSHREMAGKFVAWSDPPTLDGLRGHAGCLPNCRCYAEPVLPEQYRIA